MAVTVTETNRHTLTVTDSDFQLTLLSGPAGATGATGADSTVVGPTGPAGADGATGPNVVNSSTSSDGTGNLDLIQLTVGTLTMSDSSGSSYVTESGTGGLFLLGNSTVTIGKSIGSAIENMATFAPDSAVSLYYDNVVKLSTSATGVTTENIYLSGDIDLQDTLGASTGRVKIGIGDDLQLYHDGTNSYIANSTGTLNIQSVTSITGATSITGDTSITGLLDFGDSSATANILRFGAAQDLQIYHDGSHSYIDDTGTGDLNIRGANLNLQKYTGETFVACVADGSVSVYHDNVVMLATTASGVNVSGVVQHSVYTVATLASSIGASFLAAGMRSFVSDSANSLASHHGQTVAAGGANFVPVFYDGTNWIVG